MSSIAGFFQPNTIYSKENEFQLATTITSILTNKNDINVYQIYLLLHQNILPSSF